MLKKIIDNSGILFLLIIVLLVSGCVCNKTWKEGFLKGAVIGGALGGAEGYLLGDEANDDDKNTAIGVGIGAVVGGIIGALTNRCEETEAVEDIDSDGDGVVDRLDQCPDTPSGVKVDYKGCPLDTDGDGVYDYLDQCPGTPRGVRVDSKGCPLDSDGDGVYDDMDQCPNTPSGVRGDSQGCPLDSDRDGVPDYLDNCQDTPKGSKVDEKGCSVVGEKLLILKGIKFEFDTARITKDSEAILDVAVKTLADNPSINTKIEGHTCSIGTEEYNLGLSIRRATSVKDYIVSKGINAERLNIEGKGEGHPIASNDTKEGRKENRRVEFVVLP